MAWKLFQICATMSRTSPKVVFFIIFCWLMVGTPSTATDMTDPKSYDKGTGCTQDKIKFCPYYGSCCRISQYCSHRSRSCEPCYSTSLKKPELFKNCCEKGPHDVSWMAHETCTYACLDNFTLAELGACVNSTDVTESNNTQVDVSDAIGRNIQGEQSESQHDLTPLYIVLSSSFGVFIGVVIAIVIPKPFRDQLSQKLPKLKCFKGQNKQKASTTGTDQENDQTHTNHTTCICMDKSMEQEIIDTGVGVAEGQGDEDDVIGKSSRYKPLSRNASTSGGEDGGETDDNLQGISTIQKRTSKKLDDPLQNTSAPEGKELPTDELTSLLNDPGQTRDAE
ncbi:unnamed protein product [Lymnaea stagnalis]|uniref:Uncharacterized protein n=1 Tax=Lymnaea stagnalis TaxID=6523 RepID=A0AAV2HG03_LYMST